MQPLYEERLIYFTDVLHCTFQKLYTKLAGKFLFIKYWLSEIWFSKGQTKSKLFFQADVSSKKRTNEFNFTTIRLVFVCIWRKLKTPKRHFEINWPLVIGKLFKSSSTFNMISPQSNLSNRKVLNAWEINVLQVWPKVLIFCVEFRESSHLTRDLSQAE